MNLLFVANKILPPNDYRLAYARRTRQAFVRFALPNRPTGLDEDRFVRVGFTEGLSALDPYHFARLYWYLRRCRSGLHLTHFFSTKLILFGPVVARAAGMTSVITVTGLGRGFASTTFAYRAYQRLYRILMAASVGASSTVFFQNSGHLRLFQEWFPGHSWKFVLVGSAVTDDRSSHEKRFDASTLHVIHVARLMPSKGISDFISIAMRLASPTMQFHLAGPLSAGYKDEASQVRTAADSGVITYWGDLEREQLHELYTRAHILFFPSYGEGLSRVMLEAGLYAICPLAYDIHGNQDLVSPGRGFLVPAGDLGRAEQCLSDLASHRHRLAANGYAYRNHVRECFGIDTFVAKMDRAMSTLLGRFRAEHFAEVSVRAASEEDLAQIVIIHQEAFPTSFLTALGARFLFEYYRLVLNVEGGVLLVAHERTGRLAGLVAGFSHPDRFYNLMRRHRIGLTFAIGLGLARRPWILGKVVASILRVGQLGAGNTSPGGPVAELSSLAVIPSAAGHGIGSRLLTEFEHQITKLGVGVIQLSTNRDDNESTNAFYRRRGYRRTRQVDRWPSRPMNVYERHVGQ